MHPTSIRLFGSLATAVATTILAGCQTRATAESQAQYTPVEYRKLVSGVFVSELANKYIQVDCRFGSTMAGTLPGGLSPNRYMAFMVMAPSHGGLLEAPEPLNIVVLKDLADTVFSLKHGDSLRIKGRAVEVIARRGAGNAFRNLIVEANLIEKPQ